MPEYIQELETWNRLANNFLQSEMITDTIANRERLVKVFPRVYEGAIFNQIKDDQEYSKEKHEALYRWFNLVKGLFQGTNNKDDELELTTADLISEYAPEEANEPGQYGVVLATIFDVNFPYGKERMRPFTDPEQGLENRKRLFALLKAIGHDGDKWMLKQPEVLNDLPFRFKNALITPLLYSLNPTVYPVTNRVVQDAVAWLKGKKRSDDRPLLATGFPDPKDMTTYLQHARAFRQLSTEFFGILAKVDGANSLPQSIGLGVLDAFMWWMTTGPAERRYWTIAPYESDDPKFDSMWQECLAKEIITIGWDGLGDLSIPKNKGELKAKYSEARPNDSTAKINQDVATLMRFAKEISEGDIIIARRGRTEALGVGTVVGSYHYKEERPEHRHVIDVEWDGEFEPRKVARQFGMQTVLEVGLPTFEEVVQGKPSAPATIYTDSDSVDTEELPEDIVKIRDIISSHLNVILYGPPGTGKTYLAKKAAEAMLVSQGVGKSNGTKHINFVQFHPSYSYEDFIRGLTAETENGQIRYSYKDGIFLRVANQARNDKKPHVLIVDEINRGDIPRIFGELMYLVEYRGEENAIDLQYPGNKGERQFSVPKNLHVIGTMNTADRSIALLDTALRRRFRFVEIMPDPKKIDVVISGKKEDVHLKLLLETLNSRIREKGLREKQIGHSYFMTEDGSSIDSIEELIERFNTQILPLLQEYFIDDFDALESVLGSGFVDSNKAEIRIHEDATAFSSALAVLMRNDESTQG